jgi:PQQ-dependent dehydrogenase (methanol/ethanol family)
MQGNKISVDPPYDCVGRCSVRHLITILLSIAPALISTLLFGQATPVKDAKSARATKIFAVRCAGCHGADADGTDHGPPLVGARGLRGRSVASIRTIIRSGFPSQGMPAFDLPADELDALAAMVHSFNSPAAESVVPGDRAMGESYFFGAGKCFSCHMVNGRGKAMGPDLSNIGLERRLDEIRQSLSNPNVQIAPGYELVTVRLRNGKTIRGFARRRSNFEIVVQEMDGKFHLLQNSEIAAVHEEKDSAMPPVKASPAELQNLIAYLSRLTGVQPGVAHIQNEPESGGISWSRLLHPQPGDWLSYNGDLSGNRYSKLAQINTSNVGKLHLKWIFSVPLWKQFLPDTAYFRENMKYFGLETTPVVADGIMYVTGANQIFALDAATGQEIWQYSRPRTTGAVVGDASLGTNRGVAILGDKIFATTDNAHLIALNRTTGKLVWEVAMPEDQAHYGSTVAPLVIRNMVVAGVSGGDWGVRGFLAAYEASSGKLLWKHWTVPRKKGPEAETWGGNPANTAGGGTWLTGAYDPETDTLYWTTGNPYPDSNDSGRPGDNLYSNCILALNPDTGKLKWFYQVTPHDVHDWDANAPLILIDAEYRGQPQKLLLFSNKNGFFYVLDRTNGHVLLAKPFVRVTWASGIDAGGRPKLLPASSEICPAIGTNWSAKAFSPASRLYYVVAQERCIVKLVSRKTEDSDRNTATKYLRALNIDNGKIAWQIPQFGPAEGKRDAGVLATGGGLLFYGDPSGNFIAVDNRNGKPLWHFPTSGENKASPMTYMQDGKQLIAVAVGPNILCFGLP